MTSGALLAAAAETSTGNGEAVAFWILAPIAVLAALGILFSRKAVHSALLLAATMLCLAMLYLAQDAPFLGVVQVVVYTGAVMMLFLFVLMLVGVDSADSLVETIKGQRWIGLLAGAAIAFLLIGSITGVSLSVMEASVYRTDGLRLGEPVGLATANADGNPVGVAREVFGRYVFAFEVVATLLVIAALGAILLTHRERLTARPTQASLARERVRQGTQVPPLPAPGVFARSNAVDTPALLPDGSPSELSVSRVLAVRGQNRSADRLAGQVDVVRAEIAGRPRGRDGGDTGRDAGNASPQTGDDAVGSPPGDPADPARQGPTDAPEGTR
jgi:NADH-quinone oxidoreductase subunit J